MVVSGKPFQPSLTLVGEARSLPYSGAPEGASLGKAPALPANITLDWKGLLGPNTSLLRKFVNTTKKSFITLGPRLIEQKLVSLFLTSLYMELILGFYFKSKLLALH